MHRMIDLSWRLYILVIGCTLLLQRLHGHQVLELESNTFEVSITAYQYLAILFYDSTDRGKVIERTWEDAANLLGTYLPDDAHMAKIAGSDPDLKEIVEAYGINIPSVLVFRKGNLVDYRGSITDSEAIANYILEDTKPSIDILESLDDIKTALHVAKTAVVLGFFKVEDTHMESKEAEEESVVSENWLQFQSAADTLRGHVKFYAVTSKVLLESFSLKEDDLPTVYLFSGENEGLSRYTGPLIDASLTEWLLRNVSPAMDELSLSTSSSQQYATQFFSSRKLKFILFLPDESDFESRRDHFAAKKRDSRSAIISSRSDILEAWSELSREYRDKAIFSYMSTSTNPIADVVDYFEVDLATETPCIVAHHPSQDSRFKSRPFKLERAIQQMADYVEGVITGRITKIVRSDTVPKTQRGLVFKTVGKNVQEIVSRKETDVLLAVYASHQSSSKQILPWLEMLAKAVQGESRIQITKIDASLNDLPMSWGVKSYPALLWFPAKDKPYQNRRTSSKSDKGGEDDEDNMSIEETMTPTPRPYWDAGYNLQELVSFVTRESSFEKTSLRIATTEQLNSLQQDEEIYRVKFEEEDRYERRNEGREIYENLWIDYMLGEVAFDGKRWHIALAGFVTLWSIISTLVLLFKGISSKSITGEPASRKPKRS